MPHCLIEQLPHVPLETTPVDNNLTIDLLVGLDYYWSIVLPGVMSLGPGLVAQETVFGWLISGCAGGTAADGQGEHPPVGYQLLCNLRFPNTIINDNLVESLWDLDSVGLAAAEVNVDDKILRKFNDSIPFS